ncbi:MAG: hypothetical protein RSE29_28440, partial [Leclercia sp.]
LIVMFQKQKQAFINGSMQRYGPVWVSFQRSQAAQIRFKKQSIVDQKDFLHGIIASGHRKPDSDFTYYISVS